jgi:hypothetical protein
MIILCHSINFRGYAASNGWQLWITNLDRQKHKLHTLLQGIIHQFTARFKENHTSSNQPSTKDWILVLLEISQIHYCRSEFLWQSIECSHAWAGIYSRSHGSLNNTDMERRQYIQSPRKGQMNSGDDSAHIFPHSCLLLYIPLQLLLVYINQP